MSTHNPKWKIIEVSVKMANQIYQIDYKLPKHFRAIKGIYISVKEILSIPETSSIKNIGELSLLLNARQEHPVHYSVDYCEKPLDKFEPMQLDSSLEANQNITGYYLDKAKTKGTSGLFQPYTILIYLMCHE